jgi:hypothetical protein
MDVAFREIHACRSTAYPPTGASARRKVKRNASRRNGLFPTRVSNRKSQTWAGCLQLSVAGVIFKEFANCL